MKKIGLFGGCFNPPLITHINKIKELIENKKIDLAVFIPVGDFYNKENLIEAKHRYNMIKIAIKQEKNIKVDNIELKEKTKLYAIDAFELLTKKYKNNGKNELYYIMGKDNFEKIKNWKDYDKLKKYNYIILERDNKKEKSSTQIRKMIKEKKDILEYINKDVYKYIKKNKLYI